MPRRRVLIGILLLALVLLAGYGLAWWYFTPPASAINRANALKIKAGMTLVEVEEILGGPARNEDDFDDSNPAKLVTPGGRVYERKRRDRAYFLRVVPQLAMALSVRVTLFPQTRDSNPLSFCQRQSYWRCSHCQVRVMFDSNGVVDLVEFLLILPAEPTFLERYFEWLREISLPRSAWE